MVKESKALVTVVAALAIALLLLNMLPQWNSLSAGPVEDQATLVIVGDVMLGRGVRRAVDEKGPLWLFEEVRDLLHADLVFANLESPLADLPGDAPPALNLSAGLGAADVIAVAGIRAASLANNHALDAGPEGLAMTLAELNKRDIATVGAGSETFTGGDGFGAGKTLEAARAARILSANGIRVAVLAYSDVPQATGLRPHAGAMVSELDPDTLENEIARAREEADVVLVSLHWGEEYDVNPTFRQRDVARRAVRAGAHLVVGSHPHVIQPVEFHQDSIVAYSLGNFVFDQWRSSRTSRGQALRVRLSRSGVKEVEIIPITISSGRPAVSGETATDPNANLAFHWNGSGFEPQSVSIYYQAPELEADLDGDGLDERVAVAGGRLQVLALRGGVWREVWRTPDDWEVERAALGDVDHDGRPEIVFSLWRTYRGRFGNQPFVFGYRDGEYKPVWRGSAVADPIRELAVGDVDGDGRDELVVLEGDPAQGRDRPAVTATVWRWSGWGFYLDWRSPIARYRNLRLVDVVGDESSRGVDILLERE